jgi:hypothetical protein
MLEVDFDSWLFDICLGWEFFCKHSIPQGCLYPFIHLSRIPKCKHMEHKQIEWSFYFALHGVSQNSTPSLCLRNGTWWGFGHEWNGTLEPFP